MESNSGIPEMETPIGKELATALLAVQAGMIKNPIQKSGVNHNKGTYFTLRDILSVLRPLFVENQLIVTTEQIPCDDRMVIELLVLHVTSGQYVTRRKSLHLINNSPPQASQSIESYLRRYHYLAFFELTDSEYDDDGETAQANHPIMASDTARTYLANNAKYLSMTPEEVLSVANLEVEAKTLLAVVKASKKKERSQEVSNGRVEA